MRSLFEIAVTAIPFALLWAAMWVSLQWSYLLTLAIAVPAAGFLVRLFMIQHDCGQASVEFAMAAARRAYCWSL